MKFLKKKACIGLSLLCLIFPSIGIASSYTVNHLSILSDVSVQKNGILVESAGVQKIAEGKYVVTVMVRNDRSEPVVLREPYDITLKSDTQEEVDLEIADIKYYNQGIETPSSSIYEGAKSVVVISGEIPLEKDELNYRSCDVAFSYDFGSYSDAYSGILAFSVDFPDIQISFEKNKFGEIRIQNTSDKKISINKLNALGSCAVVPREMGTKVLEPGAVYKINYREGSELRGKKESNCQDLLSIQYKIDGADKTIDIPIGIIKERGFFDKHGTKIIIAGTVAVVVIVTVWYFWPEASVVSAPVENDLNELPFDNNIDFEVNDNYEIPDFAPDDVDTPLDNSVLGNSILENSILDNSVLDASELEQFIPRGLNDNGIREALRRLGNDAIFNVNEGTYQVTLSQRGAVAIKNFATQKRIAANFIFPYIRMDGAYR